MTPLSTEQIRTIGRGLVGRYGLGEGSLASLAATVKTATDAERAAILAFATNELAGIVTEYTPVATKIEGLNVNLANVSKQYAAAAAAKSRADAATKKAKADADAAALNAQTIATQTMALSVALAKETARANAEATRADAEKARADREKKRADDGDLKIALLGQEIITLNTTVAALKKLLGPLAPK